MTTTRHRHRHRRRPTSLSFAAVAFLLLASVLAFKAPPQLSYGVRQTAEPRRQLFGLGSWPPTCRSKCGSCTPCQPVHVPVQPGRFRLPLEYYPEAWRCKCGNTLFMP